jgi:heme exporter protein A
MPSPDTAPVVSATQLCRRFGRRWAYARVDLEVAAGERLLVVGANGSGKTTLLRSLATILRPSQGDLRLFGLDPWQHASHVRPRLALLGHSLGLYEDLSAGDNLRVVGRLADRPPPDTADLLGRVGLDDRPDPVRAYSAGMRKRLQVAALLVQKPDLILLDEPFAALDPAGVDDLADLISTLPGAVVMASHQILRASEICDRALLLEQGLPRWSGPASQALHAWRTLHPRAAAEPLPAEGGR